MVPAQLRVMARRLLIGHDDVAIRLAPKDRHLLRQRQRAVRKEAASGYQVAPRLASPKRLDQAPGVIQRRRVRDDHWTTHARWDRHSSRRGLRHGQREVPERQTERHTPPNQRRPGEPEGDLA